jgi:hypothetical protein
VSASQQVGNSSPATEQDGDRQPAGVDTLQQNWSSAGQGSELRAAQKMTNINDVVERNGKQIQPASVMFSAQELSN